MEKKKSKKFNIFFIILFVLTLVSTTYAWILDVDPIIAQYIEYKGKMVIAPTSITARLEYDNGESTEVVNNAEGAPLFKLNKMVPGKMYNFYLYLANKSDLTVGVAIFFEGIHIEENAKGVKISDKIWYRVQMVEGYDVNQIPPSPEFIMLNDESRLTYKEASNTYDYELLKSAQIMPETDIGEAKFLISIMIDTSADSNYEGSTLTIDSIRIDT